MMNKHCLYPAYEPSGVSWLGDVPAHWEVRRAGWLFRKMDRPVRDTDQVITCFRDGTVTLRKNRRTEGFTESLQEIGYQGIRRGDLVIHQMDAFAGAVGVSDSDGKGTPVYSVCHPTHDADPFYYAHVVREMARNQWILALAKGIRERSTDFRYSEFARQEFPFPPLPEQAAIVHYLDYVDRRIRRYVAAKRKLIALLEEEKQAVVNRAVTRSLDPNVRLKSSGVEWLGDVPEHWEVQRLKSSTVNAVDLTGEATNDDIYLALEHVESWTGNYAPADDAAFESSVKRFKAGDVLFGKLRPYLAKVACPDQEGVCVGEFLVLRPSPVDLSPKYLERMMRSRSVIDAVNATTFGAKMPRADWHFIGNMRLPSPPLSEQEIIVEHLDKTTADIDAAIARSRRQIELVQEFHTRLIADVVTGKLDVREAVTHLPDEDGEEEAIDGDGLVLDNTDDGSSEVSYLMEEKQAMKKEVTA